MIIRRKEKTDAIFWRAIPSRTAEDRQLSLEARGLLFYILVKPNNWELKREDLLRAGFVVKPVDKDDRQGRQPRLMSERMLRRLLFELEQAGYLKRVMQNTASGAEWIMDAYDQPLPLDQRSSLRGRTKRKNDDSPSDDMCNLGSPKNDEPKLHMPKLRHVQLGLEKNPPHVEENTDRSRQARKLQKHETDLNMNHGSRSHVSLSSRNTTAANLTNKKKRVVKSAKTSLPSDLEVNEALLEFCRTEAPDINVYRVLADFKDHARETGRECVDWIAALHRWCRVAQEIAEKGRIANHDTTQDRDSIGRGFDLLSNSAQTA